MQDPSAQMSKSSPSGCVFLLDENKAAEKEDQERGNRLGRSRSAFDEVT